MANCPQDSSEFGEAIKRTLADGEDLICFANAWQVSGRRANPKVPDGSSDTIFYEWVYLALTNINVRIGSWRIEKTKTGLLTKNVSILPECIGVHQFGLEEVVSTSSYIWNQPKGIKGFFTGDPCPIPVLMQSPPFVDYPAQRGLGQDKYNAHKGFDQIYFMRLTLKNSIEVEVASVFDALNNFGLNLDQRKSGGLLAKEAGKAADALGVLTPLLQEGIISQEEFDRAKAGFLGTTTEAQENSASQIRQLHSLHKDGVLTEGEFNMKKWDILSKN